MTKTIVIIATLDTKGDEALFLKERIMELGCKTIVVDPGVMGKPFFAAEVTREEVARAGGKSLDQLHDSALKGAARGEAAAVMSKGLNTILRNLFSSGKLDAVIALGGGTGSFLGTTAMKELPIGIPKLQVSTHPERQHFGIKDITLMQSVADLVGLNIIIKRILTNAAGAITGMAKVGGEIKPDARPRVGITCMGVTTPAAMSMVSMLEKKGYETILVHNATAPLEDMLDRGWIDGVIDLTANELISLHIYRTPEMSTPREDRLAQVGKKGLPWIFTPGTLDWGFFPKDDPRFTGRKVTMHNPVRFLVRTTKEEMGILGKAMAERANEAGGPVAIVIPLKGFSEVDKKGQDLYDPEADRAFIETLKENLKKSIKIIEVNAHINDKKYAEKVVAIFDQMFKEKKVSPSRIME